MPDGSIPTLAEAQTRTIYTVKAGPYTISTDPARLNLDAIYAYITHSYWAPGRAREVVAATLQNSLCFGLYEHDVQIGFARVITDYATLAYLCDVYVLEDYRGRGLGKWLVATVLECPHVALVGRWSLNTRDAHSLYARYGFEPISSPENAMRLVRTVTPP
jgi:GNAT superfamily N-acetyltransferase